MGTLKKNVNVFNSDVENNEGYKYSTHGSLSSVLANKRMSDEIIAFIDVNAKTLIDIGSGDGVYTNVIHQSRPKISITGFDPAEVAVKIARKNYPEIEFSIGNILENNTFPAKRFDVGVIRGVLHHLNNPELAIKNSGLLADQVVIVEPNGNNPVLKIIEKVSPYHRLHEERSFSSSQLKKWCQENGFVVEKMTFIGFIPMFFPTFLTKVIFFFQPFFEKIYPLKKYFGAQIVILCRKVK